MLFDEIKFNFQIREVNKFSDRNYKTFAKARSNTNATNMTKADALITTLCASQLGGIYETQWPYHAIYSNICACLRKIVFMSKAE